LTKLLDVDII